MFLSEYEIECGDICDTVQIMLINSIFDISALFVLLPCFLVVAVVVFCFFLSPLFKFIFLVP